MVRFYVMVPEVANLTPQSVIYFVKVGSAMRELKRCATLQRICDEKEWWFEMRSEHVDQRLYYYNSTVFHHDGYFMLRFKVKTISLADALKLAADKNRDILEKSYCESSTYFRMIAMLYQRISLPKNSLIKQVSRQPYLVNT